MTPTNLLIVLLLTWATVAIADMFQVLTARGRIVLALIALLLYSVWVFGAITIGR
jgi:hypothetical protein